MSITLTSRQKTYVQIGCVCVMLAIAMYGLALSTLASPILSSMGALEYISLFSIASVLGIAIMTPIGGKLGDLFGRRNIVVYSGIICILAGIGIAFVRSLIPLLILLFILGLAQGAFTAAPFIIVGLINDRKDVPKMMGILSAAVSAGGFLGSMIAGFLTDINHLEVAILIPAIPLFAGILLIGLYLPNKKNHLPIAIDGIGILLLIITLCGFLISLNFAPTLGLTHPLILLSFLTGILGLILFIRVEFRTREPLIPLRLFKNTTYSVLLLVGFASYFYLTALNIYTPIAALNVIGTSASVVGTLQFPRTLLTIFLPALVGAWAGKRSENLWKCMAAAGLIVSISMLLLGFTSPDTPILLYYVAITLTGFAESFRSVSVTPAAQRTLPPDEIGIGTSLLSFSTALSSTLAAAIFGATYNANIAADPGNPLYIQRGVNAVFLFAAAVSLAGLLLVCFMVRPRLKKDISSN